MGRLKGSKNKYSNGVRKNCIICKKEFIVSKSRLRIKYCSRECYHKSQIGCIPWNKGKIFLPHNREKKMLSLRCLSCGKSFMSYPSDNKKFCCRECFNGYSSKKIIRKCIICKKEYVTYPNSNKKYCGYKCYSKILLNTGESHFNWKGNNVGYHGIHHWVMNNLGKPTKCEHCGKEGLTGKKIHWANTNHLYKRNLTGWIRLCASCHRKYDLKNNRK